MMLNVDMTELTGKPKALGPGLGLWLSFLLV